MPPTCCTSDSTLRPGCDGSLETARRASVPPASWRVTSAFQRASSIGVDAAPAREAELLINLADELPQDPGAFPRIAEIVTSDDDCRRRSRKLYADYRAQGHSLESHEL